MRKQKLTALADAVREKTGETSPLSLDAMATLISALEVGGGGLPEGWAMGEFVTTEETMRGGFEIEHGLGAIPNVLIIYCDSTIINRYEVRGAFRVSYNDFFDDELGLYYPEISGGRVFYSGSNTSSVATTSDGDAGADSNLMIFVPIPSTSNVKYTPGVPYKWVAIRL